MTHIPRHVLRQGGVGPLFEEKVGDQATFDAGCVQGFALPATQVGHMENLDARTRLNPCQISQPNLAPMHMPIAPRGIASTSTPTSSARKRSMRARSSRMSMWLGRPRVLSVINTICGSSAIIRLPAAVDGYRDLAVCGGERPSPAVHGCEWKLVANESRGFAQPMGSHEWPTLRAKELRAVRVAKSAFQSVETAEMLKGKCSLRRRRDISRASGSFHPGGKPGSG